MAAFVARYAQAFLEVVTADKLDTAAIESQLNDFLATWDGSRRIARVLRQSGDSGCSEGGVPGYVEQQDEAAKGTAQPAGGADQQRSHRTGGGSGRGLSQAVAGAVGNSPGGDCDGARVGRRGTQCAGGGDRQAGGREIEASFKLDPSILGGTVVRIGSTVYDGSVRGRLDRLKEALGRLSRQGLGTRD